MGKLNFVMKDEAVDQDAGISSDLLADTGAPHQGGSTATIAPNTTATPTISGQETRGKEPECDHLRCGWRTHLLRKSCSMHAKNGCATLEIVVFWKEKELTVMEKSNQEKLNYMITGSLKMRRFSGAHEPEGESFRRRRQDSGGCHSKHREDLDSTASSSPALKTPSKERPTADLSGIGLAATQGIGQIDPLGSPNEMSPESSGIGVPPEQLKSSAAAPRSSRKSFNPIEAHVCRGRAKVPRRELVFLCGIFLQGVCPGILSERDRCER